MSAITDSEKRIEIDQLKFELAAANKRADAANEFLSTVIDFLRFAPLVSGICVCGDLIKGHGNAMNCGHSPVDSGAYHIGKLIEKYEMRHAEMSDTPRTDAEAISTQGKWIRTSMLVTQVIDADVCRHLERDLAAANKRADEAIRRLQHMHSAHSDSVQWYQNAVAQALKSLDDLPAKLEF